MKNLKHGLLKMGFIKRSIITLAMGFAAALLFAIAFEELYYFLANHSGVAVGAGLIGSQVWLYKPDKARNGKTNNTRQSALQANNPKQMAERQTSADGKPANSKRVTLEEEVQSLGDDFSRTDGESDSDEDPETFADP